MLHPSSTGWPIRYDDPWENPQPGCVAPLRHDLALASYLERQRAWRASTVHRFGPWTIAIRLHALIARAGRAFFHHRRRRELARAGRRH